MEKPDKVMKRAEFVKNLVGAVMDVVAQQPKSTKATFDAVVQTARERKIVSAENPKEDDIILAAITMIYGVSSNKILTLSSTLIAFTRVEEAWEYYEEKNKPPVNAHD